ncbi:MAG: 16S rRNA (uracil(1498)-N(3))-methyltransferase [Schwartzia sp. (in: firmicutes)]
MRRLFLPGSISDVVCLTGQDAHHVGYTLRAKVGDLIVAVGEDRQVAEMEVTAFTKDTVTLRRRAFLAAYTEPPVDAGLAVCLLKGDKMSFVVQKAVELGAAFIQPLRSENCVVRYDEKKSAARCERWQRVAEEAAKQCGRTMIPTVEPIRDLTAWLADVSPEAGLFLLYEREQHSSLRTWLKSQAGGCYTALIGPEGGFTPEEASVAQAAGAVSVTMGPRILRAETAALAALAAVMYEKGDWGAA